MCECEIPHTTWKICYRNVQFVDGRKFMVMSVYLVLKFLSGSKDLMREGDR
jgi:hypothetical protein